MSPQNPLSFRLTNPSSLSLSSQERYYSLLTIFLALLCTHSKRLLSFLHWGSHFEIFVCSFFHFVQY